MNRSDATHTLHTEGGELNTLGKKTTKHCYGVSLVSCIYIYLFREVAHNIVLICTSYIDTMQMKVSMVLCCV